MFDAIAPRYDLLNRLMSFGMDRGWRRHAVDQALEDEPSTILDAGAGTFDLSLDAWRRSANAPRIIALDFAGEMLAHGMARARRAGADVRALQGDALRLPLESGSVDAVVSAFLPRNLDSLPRAWSSFARVLRPGGVLVILEMTPVRTPVFRHLFPPVLPSVDSLGGTPDQRSRGGLYLAAGIGGRLSHGARAGPPD